MSVVDLNAERARRQPDYDGIVCECGSAWFNARVALNPYGFVWSSSANDVTCTQCGALAPTPIAGEV